jgi:hypothetical protein
LHTAIQLWFNEGDLASIHTLALAAQGILEAMCRNKGIKKSELQADTESRPKLHRNLLRGPQNFFKHGHHKQRFKGVVSLVPVHTEIVMMDCVSMYERLFGQVTSLMDAFGKKILPKFEEIKNQGVEHKKS